MCRFAHSAKLLALINIQRISEDEIQFYSVSVGKCVPTHLSSDSQSASSRVGFVFCPPLVTMYAGDFHFGLYRNHTHCLASKNESGVVQSNVAIEKNGVHVRPPDATDLGENFRICSMRPTKICTRERNYTFGLCGHLA